MLDAGTVKRPMVLLLAGEIGETWSQILGEAGFEVLSPGWLDAVPATRLAKPDLVLVSWDLPAHAPSVLISSFRSARDLARIPLAIAGISEQDAALQRDQPVRADRYVASPIAPESLVREVREAIRIGRVPWRPTPSRIAILATGGAALIALGVRVLWRGISFLAPPARPLAPVVDGALLVGGLTLLAAAIALAVVTARRPFTIRQRRSAVLSASLWLALFPSVVGPVHPILLFVAFSLACASGIEWARLGVRLQPFPTAGWRRWYQFLILLLAVFGVAPWVALALLR